MTRLTLEQAYRDLSPERLDEVKNYIGVLVPAENAEAAWNWLADRTPEWDCHGQTYRELHGDFPRPAAFHFLQKDKALAMEFKLTFA